MRYLVVEWPSFFLSKIKTMRDYSDCGYNEEKLKYMTVNAKKGVIIRKVRDEYKEVPHINGYVDSVKLEYDQGKPEKEIAPHWKLNLYFSMPDPMDENKVSKFLIRFSMNWKTVTSNLINTFLGAPDNWEGAFHMRIYKKEEQRSANIYLELGVGNPKVYSKEYNLYPFDENLNWWAGVPKYKTLGQDAMGRNINNWDDFTDFWLQKAKTHLIPKINALTGAQTNQPPTQAPQINGNSTAFETIKAQSDKRLSAETDHNKLLASWQKMCAYMAQNKLTSEEMTFIASTWQIKLTELGKGDIVLLAIDGSYKGVSTKDFPGPEHAPAEEDELVDDLPF